MRASAVISSTLFISSIASSLIGLQFFHGASAGRGGAIAVAFSFGILFFTTSRGNELLASATTNTPRIIAAMKETVADDKGGSPEPNSVLSAIVMDKGEREKDVLVQSTLLSISGILGTIVWGFGDLISP